VPQLSVLPQPSPARPQLIPSELQVAPTQFGAPHWNATPPPPHVCPFEHVPQLSRLPHPLGGVPQFAPSDVHVAGVQPEPPHRLATPAPPQVCPAGQVPQSTVTPPQPSLWGPHAPG
jgi:hypothetical protein